MSTADQRVLPRGQGRRGQLIPGLADRKIIDLRSHLAAISRFWRTVALVTAVGLLAALIFNLVSKPTYETNTTFFVATSLGSTNTALQADQFAQARINSYVGVINSERLAQVILTDTKLPLTTADISDMITAAVNPQTVLLNVTVTSTSKDQSLLVARSLAKNLDAAISELDNRGDKSNVQLRVITGPTLNPVAVTPRKKLNLALGLLLGLGLGIAQALIRQQLDNTFRSREHLAEDTGLPTLSMLHFDKAAKTAPILTPAGDHSRRAETFRQLRTNLRFADAASPIEILVVTSSVASEGKTTTAANLAVSFSEAGRRVLLIDGDLRKPRLGVYLDLESAAGLTSILIGEASVDDVVQEWGEHGLHVLTSGPIPPNPSELLGSTAMEKLIRHLRTTYDLVIIDTPPLLPVTDAAVTAVQADGVLLVVEHGKTRIDQVMQSVEALGSVDARVLGTVLTMTPNSGREKVSSYYEEWG